MRRRIRNVLLLSAVAASLPAQAQQSPGYRLTEQTFQPAGSVDGAVLESPNFLITLVSVGDPLAVALPAASPGFGVDSGFLAGYAPPEEVRNLRLRAETIEWDPAGSAESYDLYRGGLAVLGAAYGTCLATGIVSPSAVDPEQPPAGEAYFYLVTARNRLGEQGPAGVAGGTTERMPDGCP